LYQLFSKSFFEKFLIKQILKRFRENNLHQLFQKTFLKRF
jgi:hypothetical protein